MDITGLFISASDILFYVFLFGMTAVISVIILFILSFKHHVRIREYGANGVMSIIDDRAKEVKDKDGNLVLKLRKKRVKIPMPPKEAVDINQKGKWVIEVYRLSSGVYQYCNTVQNEKDLKETTKEINAFEPLTDTKKIFYLNQIAKAKKDEGLDKEKLFMTLGSLAFVLILVGIVIFGWADFMEPVQQTAVQMYEIAQTQAEITRMLQEMIQNKQTFAATGGIVPPN